MKYFSDLKFMNWFVDSMNNCLGGLNITVPALAGIAGGGILSIVVLILIVCMIRRKRKRRRKDVVDGGKIYF